MWVILLILALLKNELSCTFGGEGADELFGGYETYLPKHLRDNPNITDYTKIFKNTLFKDTKDQILFKEKMKIKKEKFKQLFFYFRKI